MSALDDVKIVDKCPSCGSTRTLFIGEGGYLTCSLIGCPEPGVGRAIAQLRAELAQLQLMQIGVDHENLMLMETNAQLRAKLDEAKKHILPPTNPQCPVCGNYHTEGFICIKHRGDEMTNEEWKAAKEHVDQIDKAYFVRRMAIALLQDRYDNGERTPELYAEILAQVIWSG